LLVNVFYFKFPHVQSISEKYSYILHTRTCITDISKNRISVFNKEINVIIQNPRRIPTKNPLNLLRTSVLLLKIPEKLFKTTIDLLSLILYN